MLLHHIYMNCVKAGKFTALAGPRDLVRERTRVVHRWVQVAA